MLQLFELYCTSTWRKFDVVCWGRPMQWLLLMWTLPLLSLGRLGKQSQTKLLKEALRLMVLRTSCERISAFELVVCENKAKLNYYCLHIFHQDWLIKCCRMWFASSTLSSVGLGIYQCTVFLALRPWPM